MSLHPAVQFWYEFLIFVLCLTPPQHAASSPHFTAFFNAEGTTKFNHLVVDKHKGGVFVGAVNKLYQLSPKLEPTATYTTWPNNPDPMKCSQSDYSSAAIKKLNNHNKVLIIDYNKSHLVACGSNFDGICTTHDISNISNRITSSCEPVVGNSVKESTVAFIPFADSKSTLTSALYVGVTYLGNSTYPSKVPAIATRSLKNDTLFKIKGANISIDPQYRNTFSINYVYGFSFGPYSYFLTTQKSSTGGSFSYVSKIIRMCNKNDNSYIEIPIKCADKHKNIYNLVQAAFIKKTDNEFPDSFDNASQDPVLFAIFSQSTTNNSNEPRNRSAICVYSLPAINHKFIQNVVSCLTGNGYQGSKFIPPNKPCGKVNNVTIDSDVCWSSVETPLGGIEPVESVPVLKFDTILSAINIASTGKYTVAFIGTQTGFLKKIVVKGTTAQQYDADIKIHEGSPVISLQFDEKEKNLYVMTEHELMKMPVQDCLTHQTDHDCLDVGDPYCGWCLHQNKCTLVDECLETENVSSLWVPYDIRAQLSISKIEPETAPLHEITNLTSTVENLPPFKGDFFCRFTISNTLFITNGTRIADKISCPTPKIELPQTKTGKIKIKAKLSFQTTNITDLVYKRFEFYDCNAYSSCSSCVGSSKCYWCVLENTCVNQQTHNCFDQTAENSPINVSKNCPSSDLILDGLHTNLISDSTSQSIAVKTRNFHYFHNSTRFFCRFRIGNDVYEKDAIRKDNMIICEEMEFTYLQHTPNITVVFEISADKLKNSIDNSEKMLLTVYKCRHMANDLSSCLGFNEKYKCIWCNNTNHCEIESQFPAYSEDCIRIEQSDVSLNPSFLYFFPKNGPFEGGTNVTIRNVKQSYSFEEIKNAITIAGVPCIPFSDLGTLKDVIMCTMTGNTSISSNNVYKGPVEIHTKNFHLQSENDYAFVDPKITDIFPKQGPRTGGTKLTIIGENMKAGGNVEVFINDLPCMVLEKTFSTLKCLTTATRQPFKGEVIVKFDGNIRIYEKGFYEYIDINSSVEPSTAFIPKGVPHGGTRILVSHFNLTLIVKAQINVVLGSNLSNPTKFHLGECYPHDVFSMTCLSPTIPEMENCSSNSWIPKFLHYSINMISSNDRVLGFSIRQKYPRFILYCDPIYKPSWGISNNTEDSQSCVEIIVISVTIFLISVLFLLYKMFLKSRMRKKVQDQIDRLELCVAAECKEAFAELQTEISDSRVSGMPESLPFWDYRTYVMNILFSNVADHSVILCDKPELTNKRKELRLFSQLILNKPFLLIFIRTLESDESFSMNDRVYFASMIMISLQNEMEYCTDVIKALLASLIGKSMKRMSQPKMLFRRSETIVEKMISAWFAFLLYKFLLQCVGNPLFILFKGIKQQVYKGPIDEITSEARYSLNENKLIRQHIDYTSITVYVSVSQQTAAETGLRSAVENVPVKILNCDTISQAKEKAVNGIYFSINYSKRPKPSELNLESVTELSGSMVLYDTDFSSEIEGEWKRRNTLQHYGIDDGSMLQLVLIKKDLNPVSFLTSTNDDVQRPACETLRSTIIQCASPKIHRARYKSVPDIDGYYKEWHLVKPNQSYDSHTCHDGNNMVSEVYLTRLLSTKGTLQKFVDDLFEIIFSQLRQNDCFPIAIKYMFDFLDDQALEHGISDPEIVHSWKNNCLPLRFWVNLIKNPDFLFDICKSNVIDACLSVVAQAFMDSCSISENRLGKDSPTAKLLYAKDIPFYKEWVKKYYADIKAMPAVSRDDMSALLGKESQLHCMDFNTNAAVYELYKYAVKYKGQLMAVLREDQSSQKYNLANKLEEVLK